MIARILRSVWLAQVALALGVAVWGWSAGVWGGGAALLLLLVLPFALEALFIGLQFLLAARANRRAAAEPRPLGARAAWRAWLQETAISIAAFDWQMAWREHAVPDFVPHHPQRGVVLVHGYFCNRGLWQRQMRRLREAGVPHVAVTLEPAFGSITDYAEPLHAAVERLRRATGLRPVLLGHSMGGLAARAYLARYGASAVHTVITLGTPHHGTVYAAAGSGRNAAQMRTASGWLQSNLQQLGAAVRERFICFASNGDNIVAPYDSAWLEAADNRYLDACGHVRLIMAPAVWAELQAQLGVRLRPL